MKIRTDFVTNSSSSSFIFDGTLDLADLAKKAVVIPDEYHEFYNEKDWEWIQEKLQWTIGDITPLKDFCNMKNFEHVLEIAGWYEDSIERPYDRFRRDKNKEIAPVTAVTPEEKMAYQKQRRQYMASAVFEYVDDYYRWERREEFTKGERIPKGFVEYLRQSLSEDWGFIEELSILGSENTLEEMETYISELKVSDNWIYMWFKDMYPKAEYVYFDELELHYLIAEAIDRATDSVMVYCCHMG